VLGKQWQAWITRWHQQQRAQPTGPQRQPELQSETKPEPEPEAESLSSSRLVAHMRACVKSRLQAAQRLSAQLEMQLAALAIDDAAAMVRVPAAMGDVTAREQIGRNDSGSGTVTGVTGEVAALLQQDEQCRRTLLQAAAALGQLDYSLVSRSSGC
jgi:hypothetical protein